MDVAAASNRFAAQPAAPPRRHNRNRYRPTLERCEGRVLLTTYTVTALTDAGAGRGTSGDLRYCIAQANADGERDTINFVVTGTISLGSPLPSLVNGRGITINGPGAGALTVRGGGTANSFTILRVKDTATATISGLTMTQGSAPRAGGAIFNGGNLTVANMSFTENTARVNGGALNNVGTLTVSNTLIAGNTARSTGGGTSGNTSIGNGGGINNAGTLTIRNSTIAGNSAGTAGGGLDSIFSTVRISGTTISGNTADVFGGGISFNGPTDFASRGGSLTITDSTVSANKAGTTPGTGYGGGIGSNDTAVRIDGTSFLDNSSGRRAGGTGFNGGAVSITDSAYSGNATGGDGGGLSINGGISITGRGKTGGSTLNLVHSTFEGNKAGRNGGGIEATSTTARITDTTFTANSAGSLGGGISLDFDPSFTLTHGSLTLADSSLVGNIASKAGGGISNSDQLIINGTTIAQNIAGETGGGIDNRAGLTIRDSPVTQNLPNNVSGRS